MTTDEINSLIDTYSSMSVEQLHAVMESPEEYRPEELCAARMVLDQRSRAVVPQTREPPTVAPLAVTSPPLVQQVALQQEGTYCVKITAIDIPFLKLERLIFKIALASIPACFMLWLLGFVLYSLYLGWTYKGPTM